MRVAIEEEDVDIIEDKWGFCLIGYIAGKHPGKGAVIQCCNGWGVKYQLQFHSSGWIVIKMGSKKDMELVISKGPFMIYGRPFMVKEMPDLFNFNEEEFSKVPMWIRLHNLPLGLWNERALSKIVSSVGIPLQTDMLTQSKQRISFARVLVEVDVAKEIVNSITIDLPRGRTIEQHVDYEYLPRFCKSCKCLGHSWDTCKDNQATTTPTPTHSSKATREQPTIPPPHKPTREHAPRLPRDASEDTHPSPHKPPEGSHLPNPRAPEDIPTTSQNPIPRFPRRPSEASSKNMPHKPPVSSHTSTQETRATKPPHNTQATSPSPIPHPTRELPLPPQAPINEAPFITVMNRKRKGKGSRPPEL